MNVQQLRAVLEHLPDDMLVVLQRGHESNHAALAISCREAMFVPHTPWQGFIFGLAESDSLGERAARALIVRPAS